MNSLVPDVVIPEGRTLLPPLYRQPDDPFKRHLAPDFELAPGQILDMQPSERLRDLYANLPRALEARAGRPAWNSVALFFNLTVATRPADFQSVTAQDARNWLDEGVNPATPPVSDFMCNYWRTLSYGRLVFGVNTPRNAAGAPLIPTVAAPNGDPQDWGGLINACLAANPEAVWRAAGGLLRDGKRWIPSLVLVQRYSANASAGFGGYERVIGGNTYLIGDVTHIRYDLGFVNLPGVPQNQVRNFWATLCHEYAHNFLEFVDLYGPQGCTGYWDLLGDNSPPGRMSEVCSAIKARAGWLSFKHVVNGPVYPLTDFELAPYTASGEAIKVVPDPQNNPYEYFLLEFRGSTGSETWRPDGALQDEGLLIIHMNERMGSVSPVWLLRDAPFFDPEFADNTDNGGTLWTGHDRLNGVLFPQGARASFTPFTHPSSNFYGRRPSGLDITNIRVEGGRCKFRLQIQGGSRVGWTVSINDRGLAGRFTGESATGGQEIFMRNENSAALLIHRQAQWFVLRRQDDWIDGWNLGCDNYEVVGDLDGDGRDEIYIRSPEWAGVLKWMFTRFHTITLQNDWIDGWNLARGNRELAGDLDGDGRDEIYIRSANDAGVIKLVANRLRLQSIQQDWIDAWNLGPDNSEYVGRFSQGQRAEVMVRSPEWMGLLAWDAAQRRLRLLSIQNDWIDGWNMSALDRHAVGDFDGDGRDEIFIRSPEWAGVLKWVDGRFRVLWIRQGSLERLDGNADGSIPLRSPDLFYAGRFLPNRDGILHRNDSGVAVVTWENGAMRIRQHMFTRFGGLWAHGASDRYVLGDFHRSGPDIGEPATDYVGDGLTDVFVHNTWGTGMFGVNYLDRNPGDPNSVTEQIGLTWIQFRDLLFAS